MGRCKLGEFYGLRLRNQEDILSEIAAMINLVFLIFSNLKYREFIG